MKESTRVLVALGLAIAGGIAIAASGNASLARAADLVAPFGALWVNAIRMTVIPLVVSLLVVGVASASDIRSVGRIGGRTLLVFLALLIGVAVVVMPLAPALFALLPRNAAHATLAAAPLDAERQTFAAWLTSLLPSNPIAAAATGAMMPLIHESGCRI